MRPLYYDARYTSFVKITHILKYSNPTLWERFFCKSKVDLLKYRCLLKRSIQKLPCHMDVFNYSFEKCKLQTFYFFTCVSYIITVHTC